MHGAGNRASTSDSRQPASTSGTRSPRSTGPSPACRVTDQPDPDQVVVAYNRKAPKAMIRLVGQGPVEDPGLGLDQTHFESVESWLEAADRQGDTITWVGYSPLPLQLYVEREELVSVGSRHRCAFDDPQIRGDRMHVRCRLRRPTSSASPTRAPSRPRSEQTFQKAAPGPSSRATSTWRCGTGDRGTDLRRRSPEPRRKQGHCEPAIAINPVVRISPP